MKIKPQRIPFEKFKEIYNQVPRLCVDVIIKHEDGVVLTKRSIEPAKGLWHIPGGTVLKGETLEETAKRVAKEELGVEIKVGEMLGIIEYLEGSFKNYSFQDVTLEFSADILSGEIKAVRDAEEARFFKILPVDMIEQQKDFLIDKLNMV